MRPEATEAGEDLVGDPQPTVLTNEAHDLVKDFPGRREGARDPKQRLANQATQLLAVLLEVVYQGLRAEVYLIWVIVVGQRKDVDPRFWLYSRKRRRRRRVSATSTSSQLPRIILPFWQRPWPSLDNRQEDSRYSLTTLTSTLTTLPFQRFQLHSPHFHHQYSSILGAIKSLQILMP